jgi:hypothetical protein
MKFPVAYPARIFESAAAGLPGGTGSHIDSCKQRPSGACVFDAPAMYAENL